MGLFDFLNKKKSDGKLKNPEEFYHDCVTDFHQEAQKCGVAQKGVIFIPELSKWGEGVILAYLKDPFFRTQFGDNPQTYYYVITSLAISAGIVLANKWHEDFEHLQACVVTTIAQGPAKETNALLSKYFPERIAADQGNPFFSQIFDRWLGLHEKYWQMNDPREYTVKAFQAAFQLGVSMMLEKLGY